MAEVLQLLKANDVTSAIQTYNSEIIKLCSEGKAGSNATHNTGKSNQRDDEIRNRIGNSAKAPRVSVGNLGTEDKSHRDSLVIFSKIGPKVKLDNYMMYL